MRRKPIIGITPDINDIEAPETEYVVRKNYADAVLRAGGLPVILPFGTEAGRYLTLIDGLLVTGGMFDIDPWLYRQAARKPYVMKPERTAFEKALIEGARKLGMPVLGICNGMQLLAVCLGGELVQDIPTEIKGAYEHKPAQPATITQHDVEIISRPRHLDLALGGTHAVNSVHHQSVLPADAYDVLAVAPDGVIEALEARDGGFAVGIQWHPEYGASQIDNAVWSGFLAAASQYCSNIRSSTMMQTPEQRLQALGLSLPRIVKPAGNLLGFKIDRGRIYVSGQLPLDDGTVKYAGKVGEAVSREDAYAAAKLAALNVVAQLSLATDGDLSRIENIVKVSGFVNCTPDFTEIAAVIDGASDLLVSIFGDLGSHARFAIGVAALPRGVPVEIELIARLRDMA